MDWTNSNWSREKCINSQLKCTSEMSCIAIQPLWRKAACGRASAKGECFLSFDSFIKSSLRLMSTATARAACKQKLHIHMWESLWQPLPLAALYSCIYFGIIKQFCLSTFHLITIFVSLQGLRLAKSDSTQGEQLVNVVVVAKSEESTNSMSKEKR